MAGPPAAAQRDRRSGGLPRPGDRAVGVEHHEALAVGSGDPPHLGGGSRHRSRGDRDGGGGAVGQRGVLAALAAAVVAVGEGLGRGGVGVGDRQPRSRVEQVVDAREVAEGDRAREGRPPPSRRLRRWVAAQTLSAPGADSVSPSEAPPASSAAVPRCRGGPSRCRCRRRRAARRCRPPGPRRPARRQRRRRSTDRLPPRDRWCARSVGAGGAGPAVVRDVTAASSSNAASAAATARSRASDAAGGTARRAARADSIAAARAATSGSGTVAPLRASPLAAPARRASLATADVARPHHGRSARRARGRRRRRGGRPRARTPARRSATRAVATARARAARNRDRGPGAGGRRRSWGRGWTSGAGRVVPEQVGELPATAGDARSHGARGHVEDAGDLGVVEVAHVAQHDGDPEVVGKARERGVDVEPLPGRLDGVVVPGVDGAERRPPAVEPGVGSRVAAATTGVGAVGAVVAQGQRTAPAPSQLVQAGVRGDPVRPRAERGPAVEPPDVAGDGDERVLQRVLGVVIVADDPATQAPQPVVVAPEQRRRARLGRRPGRRRRACDRRRRV